MEESLLLTSDERRRFVRWLRAETASNTILAEQAAKFPGGDMRSIAQRLRSEALAAEIIANRLEQIEEATIFSTGI